MVQVRFNVSVPRARVPGKGSTRRERSEGCSLVQKSAETSGKQVGNVARFSRAAERHQRRARDVVAQAQPLRHEVQLLDEEDVRRRAEEGEEQHEPERERREPEALAAAAAAVDEREVVDAAREAAAGAAHEAAALRPVLDALAGVAVVAPRPGRRVAPDARHHDRRDGEDAQREAQARGPQQHRLAVAPGRPPLARVPRRRHRALRAAAAGARSNKPATGVQPSYARVSRGDLRSSRDPRRGMCERGSSLFVSGCTAQKLRASRRSRTGERGAARDREVAWSPRGRPVDCDKTVATAQRTELPGPQRRGVRGQMRRTPRRRARP